MLVALLPAVWAAPTEELTRVVIVQDPRQPAPAVRLAADWQQAVRASGAPTASGIVVATGPADAPADVRVRVIPCADAPATTCLAAELIGWEAAADAWLPADHALELGTEADLDAATGAAWLVLLDGLRRQELLAAVDGYWLFDARQHTGHPLLAAISKRIEPLIEVGAWVGRVDDARLGPECAEMLAMVPKQKAALANFRTFHTGGAVAGAEAHLL